MATKAQASNLGIDPEVLKEIYGQLSRIHAVDNAIQKGLSSGRFQFTYWPMTGQEGIPASLSPLLTKEDYMVTIYRGIHDQVGKGVSLKELFAETMGKAPGVNKGKGGSAHVSDPKSGSMLTTGIVGAGAPIANGLALAAKMRGQNKVTIVNFGDGATSIGAVHEAMNLAGVWKLPVLFICQNNTIGEYTPVPEYTAAETFAIRAQGYGFKGVRVNGNNVVEMYAAAKEAIDDIRAGKGPVFIEAMTQRLGGHAGVGDTSHLSADALAKAKEEAPVPTTRALLLSAGICSEGELEDIDASAAAEVEEAVEYGLNAPDLDVSELFLDVYNDPTYVPRKGHYPERKAETLPGGETKTMGISQAVCHTTDLAMTKDDSVFLLGEDVGDPPGGVFQTSAGLQTKWGIERIRPTPIAEQSIIGAATGSALVGMRPIAELMFSDFTAVCLDQIVNHAAKQRFMSGGATHAPMTIRIITGGGNPGLGAQHSQSLEAWLLHVPGLKVVYPSTPTDAKGLLTSCIFDDDPCVHMESMGLAFTINEEVPLAEYSIPLGVADIKREGSDVSLITYGWEVHECLAAAEMLEKDGISAEVLDLRSLQPLDYHRILASVKKTKRALVVHAATEFCGLNAEIASVINEELFGTLKAPASRYGAAYVPIAVAPALEAAQLPRAASIAERARDLVKS